MLIFSKLGGLTEIIKEYLTHKKISNVIDNAKK